MTSNKNKSQRGHRKVRVGRVVSEKMNKTVVVAIERFVMHPLYKKYIRRTSKIYAHDEKNDAHEGDLVRVIETRPISKLKRWKVQAILERAR
ncbi:MAG: 30S ribosomal protein S17 [Candidatus Sumerlaeaceae bacterium]|nr:30S ribosomal protein S17 [Candidatus Sumerlaeaceae bacterium]